MKIGREGSGRREREREKKREGERGREMWGEKGSVAAGEHGPFSVDCERISLLRVTRIFKRQACGLM